MGIAIRERPSSRELVMSLADFKQLGWARVCRMLGLGDGSEIDALRNEDT